MRAYNIDTKFDFGKYEGRDLGIVYIFDPTYVDWCILNLEHFHIEDIEELERVLVVKKKLDWGYYQNPELMLGIDEFDSYQELIQNVNIGTIRHIFNDEIKRKNKQNALNG